MTQTAVAASCLHDVHLVAHIYDSPLMTRVVDLVQKEGSQPPTMERGCRPPLRDAGWRRCEALLRGLWMETLLAAAETDAIMEDGNRGLWMETVARDHAVDAVWLDGKEQPARLAIVAAHGFKRARGRLD